MTNSSTGPRWDLCAKNPESVSSLKSNPGQMKRRGISRGTRRVYVLFWLN